MKRLLIPVASAFIAFSSSAAIQYEFTQKNTSTSAPVPSSDMTARATIDGDRSRVEFLSGNLYPPGTYVISTDAARRLYFVDPSKQWYTEFDTTGIATAIGASGIKISNLKSSSEMLPDRPKIAGLEAEHHRITLSYDIAVIMKTIPLKQSVRTEIDTWSTQKFGAVQPTFLSNSMRTGNPDIDRLLDVETARLSGFPLRQVVTIHTNYEVPRGSKLQRPSTRTMTRETWVTSIRETAAESALFAFPAGYRRADQQELAPSAAAAALQFEPVKAQE